MGSLDTRLAALEREQHTIDVDTNTRLRDLEQAHRLLVDVVAQLEEAIEASPSTDWVKQQLAARHCGYPVEAVGPCHLPLGHSGPHMARPAPEPCPVCGVDGCDRPIIMTDDGPEHPRPAPQAAAAEWECDNCPYKGPPTVLWQCPYCKWETEQPRQGGRP